ncbi:MAG: MtlR transcriptional regulator [Clostridiales bacterium]|nr:MtlR transcriptional regulator [Clostridiales bacterium]
MIRAVVLCSLGLGSSYIIETNLKNILNQYKLDAQVIRTDITSAECYDADFYVCSEDINFRPTKQITLIQLEDLLDFEELHEKVKKFVLEKV